MNLKRLYNLPIGKKAGTSDTIPTMQKKDPGIRYVLSALFLLSLCSASLHAQEYPPAGKGWRHITYQYQSANVDILVKSAPGEEQKPKPLFFFCQGSQPTPLVIYDERGMYSIFPFKTDSMEKYYHLVIVGKPGIPLKAKRSELRENYTVQDSAGINPKFYSDHNLPGYYVDRNLALIRELQKQKWVKSGRLVVAGHSEGSFIAASMSVRSSAATHLIYASGNPFGRIMSMVGQARQREARNDTTQTAAGELEYWKYVVEEKHSLDGSHGDTPKATYDFSKPVFEDLLNCRAAVLVSYGSRDASAPYNDYLHAESIRRHKKHIRVDCYHGWEHNFFEVKPDGSADYDKFNWDKVAADWLQWLRSN